MNLIYGQIVEVFAEDGLTMGRVRVGGALKKVPLGLLPEVQSGDEVLVCDGVAISKVCNTKQLKDNYVSGDSRQGS